MAEVAPMSFIAKSGKEIMIRSFQPNDYPLVENFQKSVAHDSTHTLKYPEMSLPSQEKILVMWRECRDHPVNLHLGAFLDGRVVGNIRLFQRNPTHPWIKHIAAFAMAVAKDNWGLGIGHKLLETAESIAGASGIKRIEAEVRCLNASGVALYKKAGFKIEGTREKAAFINGVFQDEYYIAKLID